MRLSMACWTSVGLIGEVSRCGGSARTAGYAGDTDDTLDEEHPDATTASARQIAKAASILAVTQLRPCIYAFPRYALKRHSVGRLKGPYAPRAPLMPP